MSEQQQDWVIPPPAADSYGLVVRVGEGYELSPTAVEALETLARELEQEDVSGFMRSIGGCGGTFEACYEGRCQPKSSSPCAAYSICKICLGMG